MANKEHREILKQGVNVWNKWRKDHPDVEPNLRGVDLDGANLSQADLSRTDLTGANLSQTILDGANLEGARLDYTNLRRINLSGANLSEASLDEANLSGANLEGANLFRANLFRANLEGAGLGNANLYEVNLSAAYLSGANLSKINLSKINLSWADLSGADLSSADLRGATLSSANLSRADLSRADLSGANLSWANLSRADLSGANLGPTKLELLHRRTKRIQVIRTRTIQDDSETDSEPEEVTISYKRKILGVNLSHADLSRANLIEADLSHANLYQANLSAAKLSRINAFKTIFRKAALIEAILDDADLISADLTFADLSEANMRGANLHEANLNCAILHKANLEETTLYKTNLESAKLTEAVLIEANLDKANLKEADLSGANLDRARLIETNLSRAILAGCHIYGTAVWDVYLPETIQDNLIITPPSQPTITVDNLKVAQFIYLLLNNQKLREVIDTITSKVVLLIGRFTPERKVILDTLRDELRDQNYLPVVFNFEEVKSKDFLATVRILANMARFVLLDLTELGSALDEIVKVVPHCTVPLQPLLSGEYQYRYNQLLDLRRQCSWVLAPYHYQDHSSLLASFQEKIIRPAEEKGRELQQREPIPIFIGYASEDESVLIELKKHLSLLERSGQIKMWDDREVKPGEEKEKEIERQLSHARIILLLISPDFIASDNCQTIQEKAIDRHSRGEAKVIPILLRPCVWQSTPLKELQPLPKDRQPISKHSKDDIFFEVSEDIGEVIKSLG